MHNWDSLQQNFDGVHGWYSNGFNQTIKQEPQQGQQQPQSPQQPQQPKHHPSQQPSSQQQPPIPMGSQLEHYLLRQQEMTLPPSPNQGNPPSMMSGDHYFDTTPGMLQQHPLGFNPLTPPGLPNAVLPPMSHFYQSIPPPGVTMMSPAEQGPGARQDQQPPSALTPRNTPPMDVTPPKTPKMSASSEVEADPESSDEPEKSDDEAIRMPIYNSHGKMKNYRCKTCGETAITKVAFWEHSRSHIKPEKLLQCSRCPFVTELKHHLEYHIRKHKNLKPFSCEKCAYACVNKSMLNSHRKSHSAIYQYRCSDCDYATKYCHSFKLHLRKYDHQPGLVLDEDGVPNPSIVIDVYGTRRGPKAKSARKDSSKLNAALLGRHQNQNGQANANVHNLPASPARSTGSTASDMTDTKSKSRSNSRAVARLQSRSTPMSQPQITLPTAQEQHEQDMSHLIPLSAFQNHPLFPYWNLNFQMLAAQQQAAALAQLPPHVREAALQSLHLQNLQNIQHQLAQVDEEEDDADQTASSSAMDLSASSPQRTEDRDNPVDLKMPPDTPLISSTNQSLRRGRVLQLENKTPSTPPPTGKLSPVSTPPPTTELPNELPTSSSFDFTARNSPSTQSNEDTSSNGTVSTVSHPISTTTPTFPPPGAFYECNSCAILFRDAVLYTIHMGYHSRDDAFKCNMCGEKCDNAVGLFIHMARSPHN